jgi:hypothetical protein
LYIKSGDDVQRIIIEPYALGYNKDGSLILQGYQVEAFAVTDEKTTEGDGQAVIGGVFTTIKGDTWTDLSIDRVVRIEVMQNSDFAVREEAFKNVKESDKIVEVICSIYP